MKRTFFKLSVAILGLASACAMSANVFADSRDFGLSKDDYKRLGDCRYVLRVVPLDDSTWWQGPEADGDVVMCHFWLSVLRSHDEAALTWRRTAHIGHLRMGVDWWKRQAGAN